MLWSNVPQEFSEQVCEMVFIMCRPGCCNHPHAHHLHANALPFLQCVVLTMHLHCQQSKLILMRQETHPEQGEICRSTSCQQYPHMVVLVLQAHCAIEMKFLVGTVLKQTECWAVSVALFFDEDFSRNLDFLFFCLVVSGSRSWRISTACGKWDPNSQPMLSLTLLQPLVSFQLSTTLPSLPFSCAYCFFK